MSSASPQGFLSALLYSPSGMQRPGVSPQD